MTVAELLARISSRELSEWAAFFALEPFGYEADLHGSAITSSVIANSTRTKKGQKIWKPDDFLPRPAAPVHKATGKQFFSSLKDFLKSSHGNNRRPASKTGDR